jgi:hypothetical protein
MSFSVQLPPTDLCPNCERGTLRPDPREQMPRSGVGGPRTLTCDECGWSLTSNLHGSDRPEHAARRHPC